MGRKQLSVIVALIICIFLPHAALAELYGWIDENGVKHFSNVAPPEGVESFRHKSEVQSKATDANVQKNIEPRSQPSAPTPSSEDVSENSGQEDAIPQDDYVTSDDDYVTSDDDYIRRGGVNRHKKRKRHERREERREDRRNDNLDKGEKPQTIKHESGKEAKQNRPEKPVKKQPQHRKQQKRGHNPKK
jgi:hypothetical protein